MDIYVAGKYEDAPRVSQVMDQLRQAGHTITYDWTASEQVSKEQALLDLYGVLGAEAFVLVVEQDFPYCGALVELGIAIGQGIPIHIIGSALDHRCIFLHLPKVYRGIETLL